MQFTAQRIQRQTGAHPNFTLISPVFSGHEHTETPNHACPVQPLIVEPHLSTVRIFLGVEIVFAQQHAEVVTDRKERRANRFSVASAGTAVRMTGMGHKTSPPSYRRARRSRVASRRCSSSPAGFSLAAFARPSTVSGTLRSRRP